jgi:predicted outer membrane lipoprotein
VLDVSVSENVFEVLFSVAVITAVVLELTGDGITVKLAVVEPGLTVTLAGTEAEALPLESATLVWRVGATFRVTVQVDVVGAVMLAGLQVRLVGTGAAGNSVSENVFEVLFSVAVITAVVLELTGDGVTVKLALVEPELTVTEAGTAADPLPLESATLVLLVGATFRVTVQVEVVGAVMLAGLQVRLVGTGAGD